MLHPTITTCMDEMAILKHTGDVANIEMALERKKAALEAEQKEQDQPHSHFYDFDFLAQLFVGRCIVVDGDRQYCPHEPVNVQELEANELARQHCGVFDDIVACQHDIREALQGGKCLLAGLTYICENDIAQILEQKCTTINYKGANFET